MNRLALVLCLALFSGCVHTYQPMSGLRRPVVVDPARANFADLELSVRCHRDGVLTRGEASSLCQKIAMLFETQGAKVAVLDQTGSFDETLGEPEPEGEARPRTDLTLELHARQIHKSVHPLSWVISIATFTILPAIDDETFAQDIEIRDGDGFLLVTDTLQGRLVHRYGAGPWAGNQIADWLWRKEGEKVLGDIAKEELSTDLYRQLSQLVFNAKLQHEVLLETDASAEAR